LKLIAPRPAAERAKREISDSLAAQQIAGSESQDTMQLRRSKRIENKALQAGSNLVKRAGASDAESIFQNKYLAENPTYHKGASCALGPVWQQLCKTVVVESGRTFVSPSPSLVQTTTPFEKAAH
jgi:hypothetical protein